MGAIQQALLGVKPAATGNGLLNNLVSFWEMDGDATDSQGTNNGTGTNVTYTTGKVGNCGSFNGSSSYITVADNDTLDGMTAITLAAWVYPDTLPTTMNFYTKDNVTSRSRSFDIQNYTGQVKTLSAFFFVGASYSYAYPTTNNFMQTATWQHLAVTRDSAGDIQFYYNGASIARTQPNTVSGTINNSTTPVYLGKREYAAARGWYDGLIDEAGIWNTVLTSTQIATLYNSGSGLAYSSFTS